MLRVALSTLAIASAMTVMTATSPALAEDCWFPPQDPPVIPEGETATREQMNEAVAHLKDYSTRMNAHINCLQVKRDTLFYNMDKDQQARWQEDFNTIADGLTEVETAMNLQIRIFNNKS